MSSQHITRLRTLVSRKMTWHYAVERDPHWVFLRVHTGDGGRYFTAGAPGINEAARFVLHDLGKQGLLDDE